MTNLKLAIDWTPNSNHVGFFIARDLGYYKEFNLEVEIVDPAEDNYLVTPAKKLENGLVDFAITPFESVISLNNKPNHVNAIAIYTIFQSDLSSIVSLKSGKINRPAAMDGLIYASYKARYEDHIIKQMIVNDKGNGDIKITYPQKLGIWNTLLSKEADVTWIFDNWEGIEAETRGIELNKFKLENFGIPYGYSPVVIAKKENLEPNKIAYANFLQASKEGFLFAKNNLKKACEILENYVTPIDKQNINLMKSLELTVANIGSAESCGKMEERKVNDFVNWLISNHIESEKIRKYQLYTNEV